MHLQDRTVAQFGRSYVIDRPTLRKNTCIDGLAVLAGPRPYPGAIEEFERQVGDPEVRSRTKSVRIEPLEELPDIVVRADCREVVRSNGGCVFRAGQTDRLRISWLRGRGRTVGKNKSRANHHPHLFGGDGWQRVYQLVVLPRGDFLLIAIVVELVFGACRTPFAKVRWGLLRCRIKRKHPRMSGRRRVGDQRNLAYKSAGLRRRPGEHERIRRTLGSAALRLGFAHGLPLDARGFVECGDPGASNGNQLIFQAELLGYVSFD